MHYKMHYAMHYVMHYVMHTSFLRISGSCALRSFCLQGKGQYTVFVLPLMQGAKASIATVGTPHGMRCQLAQRGDPALWGGCLAHSSLTLAPTRRLGLSFRVEASAFTKRPVPPSRLRRSVRPAPIG